MPDKIYTMKDLQPLTNTELHDIARKYPKDIHILQDVLTVLEPRKRQTAIEARAFIVPRLKKRTRQRIFWRISAVLATAIAVGIAQGFGREIWDSYSIAIHNFISTK